LLAHIEHAKILDFDDLALVRHAWLRFDANEPRAGLGR
jgi:hypothetical protein